MEVDEYGLLRTRPSGQQLRYNCRCACGEYGTFEDDGDPAVRFVPVDRLEENCADEADCRNMQKSLGSGHPKAYRTTCVPPGSLARPGACFAGRRSCSVT